MKKWAFVAIGVAIAAVIAWYFASPGYAMMQLRDAALERDEAGLEQSIDFPRVRESLKVDFKAQLATEMTSGETEGFEALGAAMAMAMVDPMIDGFVNPQTMSRMITEGKLKRSEDGEAATSSKDLEWSIERKGFSSFRAVPDVSEVEDPPSLLFERDGLGWKLVEVEIPDGAMTKE